MESTGDPRFFAILEEMAVIHRKKGTDYGLGQDVLANVRSSEEFGVPAWIGTAIRLNDKIIRVKNMARKGFLAKEPLEDSLLDIANYAVLALILYREQKAPAVAGSGIIKPEMLVSGYICKSPTMPLRPPETWQS